MSRERTAKAVSDMEIDEISLVDRPANQHAAIVISKRYEEADMAEETGYFWADGTAITTDDEIGPEDQFFDADGEAYQLDESAFQEVEDAANERELTEVGKSSAFGRSGQRGGVQKSLAEELREQLSKAVGDEGTRTVVAKALEAIEKADARATRAEQIAKFEQETRREREFIAKAASYGEIPGVTPDELGPVLKRCEDALSYEDCVILNKVFESTGDLLFSELGLDGGGTIDGSDPMAVIQAKVEADVSKGAGETISKEHRTVEYFSENPAAYDDYMASKGR